MPARFLTAGLHPRSARRRGAMRWPRATPASALRREASARGKGGGMAAHPSEPVHVDQFEVDVERVAVGPPGQPDPVFGRGPQAGADPGDMGGGGLLSGARYGSCTTWHPETPPGWVPLVPPRPVGSQVDAGLLGAGRGRSRITAGAAGPPGPKFPAVPAPRRQLSAGAPLLPGVDHPVAQKPRRRDGRRAGHAAAASPAHLVGVVVAQADNHEIFISILRVLTSDAKTRIRQRFAHGEFIARSNFESN